MNPDDKINKREDVIRLTAIVKAGSQTQVFKYLKKATEVFPQLFIYTLFEK
ncbi:hypothetical protein SAMN05428977_100866 [Nitrosomonas sp. Nm166]|nr:hypothetical protein SAMN05428977_100866 [Nitrosomonas sp. Nm166]